MAENATTPTQSAAVANFFEPTVVIPGFSGGSGIAALINTITVNINVTRSILAEKKDQINRHVLINMSEYREQEISIRKSFLKISEKNQYFTISRFHYIHDILSFSLLDIDDNNYCYRYKNILKYIFNQD